jgi:hypothetical protein
MDFPLPISYCALGSRQTPVRLSRPFYGFFFSLFGNRETPFSLRKSAICDVLFSKTALSVSTVLFWCISFSENEIRTDEAQSICRDEFPPCIDAPIRFFVSSGFG